MHVPAHHGAVVTLANGSPQKRFAITVMRPPDRMVLHITQAYENTLPEMIFEINGQQGSNIFISSWNISVLTLLHITIVCNRNNNNNNNDNSKEPG
jgi:hypothetical protein